MICVRVLSPFRDIPAWKDATTEFVCKQAKKAKTRWIGWLRETRTGERGEAGGARRLFYTDFAGRREKWRRMEENRQPSSSLKPRKKIIAADGDAAEIVRVNTALCWRQSASVKSVTIAMYIEKNNNTRVTHTILPRNGHQRKR